MRHRCLTGLLVVLVLSEFAWACPPESDARVVDPAVLVEPVDVVSAGTHRDGGSFAALLEDAEGKQMPFCIDLGLLSDAKRKKTGAPERGQLLIGVSNPGDSSAVRGQRGGPEEHRILDLLRVYLDREYTPEQRAVVRSACLQREAVPLADLGLNSEQAIHLRLLMQATIHLEERCEPSN